MPPVTAHITVVAQGVKAPSAAPSQAGAPAGQDASPEIAGFARMLAAHIGQQPETLTGKAVADPAKKDASSSDAGSEGAIQQALDIASTLPLPQILHTVLPKPDHAGCCEKDGHEAPEGLPLELQSLVKAQTKQEPMLAATTANVDNEAAKFAGVHRALQEDGSKIGEEVKAAQPQIPAVAIEHRAAPLPANEQIRVDVPVGAKGWDQAVGQRLVWLANNNQQTAQLHVTPPNLGPVEIRLTITNDQASAMFVSPHAGVREALESALPRLREMFADSGLTLANVNVASEQQRQHAQDGSGQGRRRSGGGMLGGEGDIDGVEGVGGLRQGVASIRTGPNGLVDIFA